MPMFAVFCLYVLMVAALPSAAVAQSGPDAAPAVTASGAADTSPSENQKVSDPAVPAAAMSTGGAAADSASNSGTGQESAAPAPAGTAEQPGSGSSTGTAAAPAVEDNPVRVELLKQIEAARLSKEEKSALATFYESRQEGPVWVGEQGFTAKARLAAAEIGRADDWGLDASDFALPAAPAPGSPPPVLAEAELKLMQAVLKYARHARGGRMDPTDLSYSIDRQPPLLAPEAVLEGIATAEAPDAYLRKLHPQHPQFEKLRQAYLALRKGGAEQVQASDDADQPPKDRRKRQAQSPAPERITAQRILINMEQWRWMPEDLGQTYVWANIPEFMVRVVKGGKVIHAERIVAGKPDTQTPIFSDEMETIVFHPFWGVPDSIKVKEILPGLARGSAVLEKNGLRIQYRGRDIDPSSVDWSSVDIRRFHIYQPPGGGNVLGVVKFLFPNKHQVYMHDTPTKNLFNATQRSFSHGCMRVRNPLRLAEVLLAEDKGWDARKVTALVDSGPKNNEVGLQKKFPVHVTYFTVWVDDDGKLNARPDLYGHERLVQMGLEGKAHLIVKRKEDLGVARAEVVGRLAETKPNWGGGSSPSWVKNLFNF